MSKLVEYITLKLIFQNYPVIYQHLEQVFK